MKIELPPGAWTPAGPITNILELTESDTPIRGVAIIESRAGSIRSNHYHREDSHYLYVLSGSLEYFERKVGETHEPEPIVYRQGDLFFTGPMVEHAVRFLEDTTLLSLSWRPRDRESHEADVVRVRLI